MRWRGGRVLILVAHPDDETLGCGGEMAFWPDCLIAHTTNGSPRNPGDALNAGFPTPEAYAAARKSELECALALAGGRATRCFGLTDQDSWRDLSALTGMAADLIAEWKPDAIVTHPYEGGHPDHDAAAFAVQRVCERLGDEAPARIEAAFYNGWGGMLRPGVFLPEGPASEYVVLDAPTRQRKDRMFACFRSQQRVLKLFSTEVERFRLAPVYDFSKPPHEGALLYETFGWGIDGDRWREEAARAERALLHAL